MLEHRHSSIQTSEGNSANLNKQTEAQREEKLHLLDLLLFMCTFGTQMLLQWVPWFSY